MGIFHVKGVNGNNDLFRCCLVEQPVPFSLLPRMIHSFMILLSIQLAKRSKSEGRQLAMSFLIDRNYPLQQVPTRSVTRLSYDRLYCRLLWCNSGIRERVFRKRRWYDIVSRSKKLRIEIKLIKVVGFKRSIIRFLHIFVIEISRVFFLEIKNTEWNLDKFLDISINSRKIFYSNFQLNFLEIQWWHYKFFNFLMFFQQYKFYPSFITSFNLHWIFLEIMEIVKWHISINTL